MLKPEQIKIMRENWNFSFVHLMYEWEDITKVSKVVLDRIHKYINEEYTNSESVRFSFLKQGRSLGFFIHSVTNGTGKTTLLHLIAKTLLDKNLINKKLLYVTGLEIFYELKKSFSNNGGLNESDILENMMSCDVLFIDDLDKIGTLSEYEKKRFTLIIDKRYTNLKPVMITANKSISEMSKDGQLEPHIFSRLSQMCEEIEVTGEDFRLQGKIKLQLKERKKFV
mgnify:FL=1